MASNNLYFFIFILAGILLRETSTIKLKHYRILKKRDVWDEAVSAWRGSKNKVNFNLAPSYGTLTSKTLQQLDESLKVMMGGILELDMPGGLSWTELRHALDICPLLLRQEKYSAYKAEKITFSSLRFFGLGSNKSRREKYIHSWFTNLIGNVDILEATDIDVESITKMASKITIEMLDNLWSDKTKEKTLMDLGILRFPDFSKPYFSVYRINLFAKSSYQTYLLHQREKCEIIGLFEREVYYPDRDYIENLHSDFTEQLLDEVDALFSDI